MKTSEETVVLHYLLQSFHYFEERLQTSETMGTVQKKVRGLLSKTVLFLSAIAASRGKNELIRPVEESKHMLMTRIAANVLRYTRKAHFFGSLLLYHVKEKCIVEASSAGELERTVKGVSLGGLVPLSQLQQKKPSQSVRGSGKVLWEIIAATTYMIGTRSGIRTMHCTRDAMQLLEYMTRDQYVFIVASGASVLVFDAEVQKRKKTTLYQPGKYFVRLYSGEELRLHVIPSVTTKKPVRYYTTLDVETTTLLELYEKAENQDICRKSLCRRASVKDLELLQEQSGCHLRGCLQFVASICTNYDTLTQKFIYADELQKNYARYCSHHGLTKNMNSFIKYLGRCIEVYTTIREERELSKYEESAIRQPEEYSRKAI